MGPVATLQIAAQDGAATRVRVQFYSITSLNSTALTSVMRLCVFTHRSRSLNELFIGGGLPRHGVRAWKHSSSSSDEEQQWRSAHTMGAGCGAPAVEVGARPLAAHIVVCAQFHAVHAILGLVRLPGAEAFRERHANTRAQPTRGCLPLLPSPKALCTRISQPGYSEQCSWFPDRHLCVWVGSYPILDRMTVWKPGYPNLRPRDVRTVGRRARAG